jgi:uncharacterized protein (DUF2141 family)
VPRILPAGALAPALFVLISMCGSPVPPPPGSVSGSVYFDLNHNRSLDICDRPVNATVTVTTPDGKTVSTDTHNGEFQVADVPAGDAIVSLTAGGNLFWPTTQHTADGTPGVAISVASQADTGGLELSTIGAQPLVTDGRGVVGVVFNDANGNGKVDHTECGISGAGIYTNNGTGGFFSQPGDGSFGVSLSAPDSLLYASLPRGSWKATTSAADPCRFGARATPASDASVAELLIGYRQDDANGSAEGVMFNDANQDGVREEGEEGVPNGNFYLQPVISSCGAGPSVQISSGEDGAFRVTGLVPGAYTPIFTYGPSPFQSVVSQGWTNAPVFTVTGGEAATVNLPLRVIPAGKLRVAVFNDTNGNGVFDPTEPSIGAQVCLHQRDASGPPPLDYSQTCSFASTDGVAFFGQLPYGDYTAYVMDSYIGMGLGTDFTIDQPEVYIELSWTAPVEPAVPLTDGTPLRAENCYMNAIWRQSAFDDVYHPKEYLYGAWGIDEEEARRIYDVGFYQVAPGVSRDAQIWTHLTALPWRLSPSCPSSLGPGVVGSPRDGIAFYLVGYEAKSAVVNANVTQITVAATPGLYTAAVYDDENLLYKPFIHELKTVFVDESNNVLATCTGDGNCTRGDQPIEPQLPGFPVPIS